MIRSPVLEPAPPLTHAYDVPNGPQPETAQFATELTEPEFFTESGTTFGVFRLNREYEEQGLTPVVINLAHGEVAQSGAGRAGLNAFAQTIKRPLIAIDMAGMGSSGQVKASSLRHTTFEGLAASHLAILDQLGISEFDLLGYSMAAVMSTKMAELAGERVKHLVTFSAPSFEAKTAHELIQDTKDRNVQDFRRARDNAPPAVRQELESTRQSRQAARELMTKKAKAIAALAIFKYATLMREPHMKGVSTKLAPSTQWLDFSGTKDAYSNWHLHAAEVEARNRQHPGYSQFTPVNDETHAWLATRRWEVAALAAGALEQ